MNNIYKYLISIISINLYISTYLSMVFPWRTWCFSLGGATAAAGRPRGGRSRAGRAADLRVWEPGERLISAAAEEMDSIIQS